MVRITERELDSDVSVDGVEDNGGTGDLKAVVDADEALGYSVWYTIGGSFDGIPREWLLGRMEELDLPDWMAPNKVSQRSAWTRTRDFLVTPRNETGHVPSPSKERREVRFEVRNPDETRGVFHVVWSAYMTVDDLRALGKDDVTEGEYRSDTLGVFRWDAEENEPRAHSPVDKDDPLYSYFENFASRYYDMCESMQESHTGRDIQKMLQRFTTHWTRTIKLRPGGAVYFVPATYEQKLDSLKTLVEELNRYKDHGKEVQLARVPVVDSDDQRKLVEQQARRWVENRVESELDDAMSRLQESEDKVVDDVIDAVEENLSGDEVESMTVQYNALLDTRLDVQDELESWLDDGVAGVKEDVIEGVLANLHKDA